MLDLSGAKSSNYVRQALCQPAVSGLETVYFEAMATNSPNYQASIRAILGLLRERRAAEAAGASQALIAAHPESNDALLLLGKARQQQGRYDEMLQLIARAARRDPTNADLKLQYAGACHFCGEHDAAFEQLEQILERAGDDPVRVQKVAESFSHAGKFAEAHECYLRIRSRAHKDPRYLFNLASSFVAMGDIAQAEETYTAAIERQPDYYEAWYLRSTLRTQTQENNHIVPAERALKKLAPTEPGYSWLCYALAKEYEDVGSYEQSFDILSRGAASRHRALGYKVEADVAAMQQIARSFDQHYVATVPAAPERPGPIFVLGLPRSGTTLVDRVLSSHSAVESRGELTDLGLSLNRLVGMPLSGPPADAYAKLDPDAVARDYLRSVASYGGQRPCFVDKMPVNFLHIGIIGKALPAAPVVHVTRHPVDSCFAMYRMMFRNGYPFSYDLDSLADYYIAYTELMRHWRAMYPGQVHDVAYEALVKDPDTTCRALVEACGLAWEPDCLAFHRNRAPVMTASAAQVRQPLYRDAIDRWRRYESQLAPLVSRLEQAGIPV